MTGPRSEPSLRTTEGCRYCWMCRHVCPVGHVTSRETLTPHAWALTIESVRRGQLTWNAETAAVMYACADCGLCQTHCVTDQPLPDAIVAARAEITRSGRAPDSVRAYERQIREKTDRNGVTRRPLEPAPRAGVSRVLFVGEAVDDTERAETEAALRLLDAAGVPAMPFGRGLATGLLANALGLADAATESAARVVDAVRESGADEVLVLGPRDEWTFAHVYPKRLGLEWPAGVTVAGVTAKLMPVVEDGRLRLARAAPVRMGYHDPCHGARLRRDGSTPRRLLRAVAAHDLHEPFWRAERAHPCGAVGGLAVTHPDLARQLTEARIADAIAAGVELLITDDPQCLRALRRETAGRLEAAGLYSFLAAGIGG